MNVLRQAEKAGVKKFVVTSSIVTMMYDPALKGTAYRSERRLFILRSAFGVNTNVFPSTDWNPVTKEDALHDEDSNVAYQASKKYAELAVWEWAEAHPDVDVTTSKSIILFFALKLSLQLSLNSTPNLHLWSIPTQVSSTSEA